MSSKRPSTEPMSDCASKISRMNESDITMDHMQLLDMPDEVLEMIFSFLELEWKKNWSLCCRKFNEIFGFSANLNGITFHVEKKQGPIGNISRRYRSIIESGNRIPPEAWSKLTNLTSYTNEISNILHETGYIRFLMNLTIDTAQCTITSNYLMQMLPRFSNLKCLCIPFIHMQKAEEEKLQEHQEGFEILDMYQLTILKIDLQMFAILNGRFMKFSAEKLEVLQFTEQIGTVNQIDVKFMKSFIASQTNLKELSFQTSGSKINQFFDTPLAVSSQLKCFDLKSFRRYLPQFNSTQQDNVCDFVSAQKALQKLRINVEITIPRTSKIQQLMNARLDMLLAERVFDFCWIPSSLTSNFDDRVFTLGDLSQPRNPNPLMKKVDLNSTFDTPEAVLQFISTNYPNLTTLIMRKHLLTPFDGVVQLVKLKYLESLTFEGFQCRILSTINMPTLKKLNLKLKRADYHGCWIATDMEHLKTLLLQNKNIETLTVDISSRVADNLFNNMDTDFSKLIEYTLINLGNLKTFNIDVEFISQNDPVDLSKKLVTSRLKLVSEMIGDFTKSGFILKCGSTKLMKTFDGTVVTVKKYLDVLKVITSEES